MSKILILGGAGYVGSVLTAHFLKAKHDVVVIDNFIYDNQNTVSSYIGDPNYRIVQGDFSDTNLLDQEAARRRLCFDFGWPGRRPNYQKVPQNIREDQRPKYQKMH